MSELLQTRDQRVTYNELPPLLQECWQEYLDIPVEITRRAETLGADLRLRRWTWTFVARADELVDAYEHPVEAAWLSDCLPSGPQRHEVIELTDERLCGAVFVDQILALAIANGELHTMRETRTPVNFFCYPPRLRAFANARQ